MPDFQRLTKLIVKHRLELLRNVPGLDPIKDADGNAIREARLAAWANFRQRALNVAIAQINAKTD
jgi:hypothetical protein